MSVSTRFILRSAILAAALLMTACGGGGSSKDASTSAPLATVIAAINEFLLFPNPQLQPDGQLQTDTNAYAEAYYAAIDPTNLKDTLDKWKAANGFGSGTGTEVSIVFGDVRDLGYGRRMTARQNPDGTIAIMVENFLVNPAAGYEYSTVNLEAAALPDRRWHVATNGIEFSPGPLGGTSFTKFFNFNPVTGLRENRVDLDGRGLKAMPGPCLSCHGGRGDALTPPDGTGKPRFPLLKTAASLARGDAAGQLLPVEVDTLDFLPQPPYRRVDQEAALKVLNKMILCSYPIPAPSGFPEDSCRRTANANEWQGTLASVIKNAYGGDNLPNPVFADSYVPPGWLTVGQSTLYQKVVAPACRSCHAARGTGGQSDIDLNSYAKFVSYAARIKYHVFDRGNMPLALLVWDHFWETDAAQTLASFLEGQGFTVRDGAGALLRPGRPVAIPGPDRVVRQGATVLSATDSLYATSYNWSIVSGPNGATPATNVTLTNPASSQPTFTATADGVYVLQLIAVNGGTQSAPAQLRIVVNNTLTPAPASIRFSDIKTALQTIGCTACHNATPLTPLGFTNIDRNGDSVVDAVDDAWFYAELRSTINFTDRFGSPLLRKPSGNHHGGGLRPGFDTSLQPGQPGRASYDLILNWIMNGAPQ